MAVNPLLGNTPSLDQMHTSRSSGSPASSLTRTDDHGAERTADRANGSDRVELSSVSQSLVAQNAAPPSGTLSADRLRTISNRMVTGYYNQSHVQDTVARGVAGDLDG